MVTVEWFSAVNSKNGVLHPLMLDPLMWEPEHSLDFIKNNSRNLSLLKCPSAVEYLKNIFIIKSPLDFTVKISPNKKLTVVNDRQNYQEPYELWDLNIFADYMSPDSGQLHGQHVIDIGFQYYFINKKDSVVMQNIDVPLWFNQVTNVPGQFDISKWVRPTNFTFFTDKQELHFQRGDPLYAVKFVTKKNQKIKLKKITDKNRIDLITFKQLQSTNIKHFLPNVGLNSLYKIFQKQMQELFK